MCTDCGPLLDAIDRYIQKADDNLEEQLGSEGYEHPKDTVDTIKEIEEQVAAALKDETGRFLEAIAKATTLEVFAENIWPQVKDSDNLAEALMAIFRDQFSSFMPQYVDYYIAQTDRDLKCEQVSKRTTAWVREWSQELADIMQLNSHTEIEKILTAGLEKGSSIDEFARAILESGIRDEYYKARRVAITEVLRAHCIAQQEAMMQSPAVEEKMWKHTGSHRNKPRRNHQDMDGQRVPKAMPYTLKGIKGGTYYPMEPKDPSLQPEESINCHCISEPIINEEILRLPLEERQRLQQEAIDEMDDAWEQEVDARNKSRAGIASSPT